MSAPIYGGTLDGVTVIWDRETGQQSVQQDPALPSDDIIK